ncbi:MAG: chorismate synthase [Erysipelotrichales bacterium]|nr:chorismate synthase [Erysipelotrichales bacterium]
MRNSFGEAVRITLFGESHGERIGCVLDGIAPGVRIDEDAIAYEMKRRQGNPVISTARREPDEVRIVSGVYNGYTEGTPVTILMENRDVRSKDYVNPADHPRPGHADYTGNIKYRGFEDPRGGGHFSGRLTAPIVAAGAICKSALEQKGIRIGSHILEIAGIREEGYDLLHPEIQIWNGEFPVHNEEIREKMIEAILDAKSEKDSVGGIIETAVLGVPAGIGEPWFDSLESELAHILFSIPACKGVEFGSGAEFARMKGSEANDPFRYNAGKIETVTNHNGGINGGISNGMPIVFRTVFKPTPSIGKPQMTLERSSGERKELEIHGRHDPCIVPRALPVQEAVSAIVLTDLLTRVHGNLWLGETL